MSEGLAFFLLICILLSIPVSIILLVTTCRASFRTRRWKAEKRRRAALPQSDTAAAAAATLPQSQDNDHRTSDSDSDDSSLIDPDDPIERQIRDQDREEKVEDWHLTTGQKFWKEWKKALKPGSVAETKARIERTKKKQLVKSIAREMVRMQRREDRRARRGQSSSTVVRGDGGDDVELPAYQKVVGKGEK